MKKNMKNVLLPLLLVFSLCAGILLPASTVKAAALGGGTISLKTGRVYTAYDGTGDKKKDKILITMAENDSQYHRNFSVYINGTEAYTLPKNSHFDEVRARLLPLKNGKVYFYLYAIGGDGDGPVCGLFQYKGGKLVQVLDIQKKFAGYGTHFSGDIVLVQNNSIKIRYTFMSWALGLMSCDYIYSDRNGKLALYSNIAPITQSILTSQHKTVFTAAQNIPVYKNAYTAARSFSIAKGTPVNVRQAYINHGKMYISVYLANGKKGWIKSPTRSIKPMLFKETHYSG